MTKPRIRLIFFGIIATGLVLLAAFRMHIPDEPEAAGHQPLSVQLSAIQTPDGWGYEIQVNHKTYIHQTFIPVLPGHQSFATKEEALLVGKKVVEKMEQGQMPPSVTLQELEQMGIVNRHATP